MGIVITFVADEPLNAYKRPTTAPDPWLISTLEEIFRLVSARPEVVLDGVRYTHVVRRAGSLQEILVTLQKERDRDPEPPRLIQIIGHGSPGIVSLGETWTKRLSEADTVYVVDSNPYFHNVLKPAIGPATELWLIGCLSGGDSDEALASGRTLVFALSEYLGNRVAAPVDYVDPSSLSSGLYNSGTRGGMVIASDHQITNATPGVRRGTRGATVDMTILRLLDSPIRNRRGYLRPRWRPRQCCLRRYDGDHLLAWTEAILDVVVNGVPSDAHLMANLTLMRLEGELYVIDDALRADLASSILADAIDRYSPSRTS